MAQSSCPFFKTENMSADGTLTEAAPTEFCEGGIGIRRHPQLYAADLLRVTISRVHIISYCGEDMAPRKTMSCFANIAFISGSVM